MGAGAVKAPLRPANFSLGPDATLNTEIHKKMVRIKAPNLVTASKRIHKNQINHYDKQRRVLVTVLCARVNENQQLNHGKPSQRHIVKPQPTG